MKYALLFAAIAAVAVLGCRFEYHVKIAPAAPPRITEADKWRIIVVSTDNCRYCEILKHDLQRDANLHVWANGGRANMPATLVVRNARDESSKADWQGVKISGFPTLLVRPPKSGKYGPANEVVLQKTGYGGDGKRLSKEIAAAIGRRMAKYQRAKKGK